MRVFSRAVAYSLSLCALLGYLSYRNHGAPSQVERRLEQSLDRLLRTEASAEGCEQPVLGRITARSIVIPAAPPIDERTFLIAEDVRINDHSSRRAFRRAAAPENADPAPLSVHAREAKLFLDHAVDGAPGEEKSRWNFDDLFRSDELLATLADTGAEVLVESLSVRFQELRSPRSKLQWTLEAREVEARRAIPAGMTLEADLPEGRWWSRGHLAATWLPGGVITLRGGLEDLRSPAEWLPALGTQHRAAWDLFRPSGSWNVDVEDLRIAREGILLLRATVRHYDTTLRLGTLFPELSHLSGPMRVTEEGARLGPDGDGERARAEIWGLPVEVAGKIDSKGAAIQLALARRALEGLFLSTGETRGPASAAAVLIGKLRPRGTIEGEAGVTFEPGGREGFRGELRIGGLGLAGLPCVSAGDGSVSFESGEAGAGKGKVLVAGVSCQGLGALRGEVPFTWDAAGAHFTLYDMKWEVPEGLEGAAEIGRPPGSLFGTVGWSSRSGLSEVDLRWMGACVATKLLQAGDVSGKLQKGSGGQPVSGTLEWAAAVVPPGALWTGGEKLSFESGKCLFRVEEGALRIQTLRLTGRKHGLRAAGTLDRSGEIDFVVLLATGPTLAAFHELREESGPPEWKEAARGSYRAFRVTGPLSSPRSREIGGLDPAFVGKR